MFEIEGDRSFAAIDIEKARRHIGASMTEISGVVTRCRYFDLYDVGALVSKD